MRWMLAASLSRSTTSAGVSSPVTARPVTSVSIILRDLRSEAREPEQLADLLRGLEPDAGQHHHGPLGRPHRSVGD